MLAALALAMSLVSSSNDAVELGLLPGDQPALRGAPNLIGLNYLPARKVLQALGYHPSRLKRGPAHACLDAHCKRRLPLPEAECSMGPPICNTYWRTPKGRVLKVMTAGELNGGEAGGRVYAEAWASPDEIVTMRLGRR